MEGKNKYEVDTDLRLAFNPQDITGNLKFEFNSIQYFT